MITVITSEGFMIEIDAKARLRKLLHDDDCVLEDILSEKKEVSEHVDF